MDGAFVRGYDEVHYSPTEDVGILHMAPLDEPSFQDPRATLAQMAAGMNRAVERMVLHCPGQYLWGYARAKQPREER